MRPHLRVITALTLGLLATGTVSSAAQEGWTHYAGDTFQRYSALDQIDAGNVRSLEVVWRRPGLDPAFTRDYPDLRPNNYHKTTPTLVDGVMYASNAVGLVEAWDPATGRTIWRQPPRSSEEVGGQSTRGVEYWSDGRDRRIISVRGEYLYALDAITGEPSRGFGIGESGRVYLTREGPDALRFGWGSGPVVVGDVIVVAGLRGGADCLGWVRRTGGRAGPSTTARAWRTSRSAATSGPLCRGTGVQRNGRSRAWSAVSP